MTGRGDANLRQARAYARTGWPVFPCIPGEKVPATAHGVRDATTDLGQITRWWGRNPDRNVAIATGRPGPDVLDIDRRGEESGYPALNLLRREGLLGRERAVISTPSEGLHLYYAGTEHQGNSSLRGHHVDFRSTGGYVVAPPSVVRREIDGQARPYVIVRHQASRDHVDWAAIRERLDPQPELPAWKPPERLRDGEAQDLGHLVERMAGQPEGNRDGFLFWASNRVLDHGQPERLDELARAAEAAGLDRREITRTIESAKQQQRQDPHGTWRPQARETAQLAGPEERGCSQPPRRERAGVQVTDRAGEPRPLRSEPRSHEPGREPGNGRGHQGIGVAPGRRPLAEVANERLADSGIGRDDPGLRQWADWNAQRPGPPAQAEPDREPVHEREREASPKSAEAGPTQLTAEADREAGQ